MDAPFRLKLTGARILVSAIFLVSGMAKLTHYSATLEVMRSMNLWGAGALLPAATAIELLGGLALATGWQTRWASLLLAAYLVPVTLAFHRFWAFSGVTRQSELIEFLKNAAIMGGLTLHALEQRVLDAFTGGTLVQLRNETRPQRRTG